jgi:diguanylate cyclase (GGDEF)-like protein/PAS domain S-box-containing protein
LSDFPVSEHPIVRALNQGEQVEGVVMGVFKSDGDLRWVTVNSTPLILPDSTTPYAAVATFVDITEKRQAELALRQSEALLAEAQHIAMIGSYDFDLVATTISWSPEMFRLLDFDPEDGVPGYESIIERFHPEDRERHETVITRAMQYGDSYDFDNRVVLRDGAVRWLHSIGHAVTDEYGRIVRLYGTLMDVTSRKEAEEQLRAYSIALSYRNQEIEQAYTELRRVNEQLALLATEDAITGLHNHRAFQERLELETKRAKRAGSAISLVMIDVDHFKQFNDTFGHPEGDKVLREVADRLLSVIRATDQAARYGGEEFVLVLPDTDAQGALTIAERARLAIEGADWPKRAITVSLGVCSMSGITADSRALIAYADKAMYRSKRDGRNRVTLNTEPDLGGEAVNPNVNRALLIEWIERVDPIGLPAAESSSTTRSARGSGPRRFCRYRQKAKIRG